VTRLFTKVLIANRGEIAVRVIRACREMGIATVAVFSEADREALHVLQADEAVAIGPPPATESYLSQDKVIAAARATGVQAVHPGYGFLAENADFAEACAAAGLVFIGPPPAAVRATGDKLAARRVAAKLGVPLVPGTTRPLADGAEAARAVAEIGYPVMIKAALGGGGKGMRLVHAYAELEGALRAARSEAGSAFGDATVYIEKYITAPRHVEIQVLADAHGTVVHLGERECSIQRRNQKLVEESPSPCVAPEMRRRMGEAACRIAAAAGYVSAGTVEFLVDRVGNFYFLELNARLQVEHPVTEFVTGRDLVREQIRIAAGEKLGYAQDDIAFSGHAIECRINAEDPDANFMPSPGKILGLRAPGGPWVRNDSGVYEGYTVPRYYDTLMAKLIVWAPDREAAITRMDRALAEYHVSGMRTTLPVLRRIIRHPDFAAGRLDTGFMERLPGGHESGSRRTVALIAAVLEAYERAGRQAAPQAAQGPGPWARAGRPGASGWRRR